MFMAVNSLHELGYIHRYNNISNIYNFLYKQY